jgi:peroxiredoxin
MQVGDIAPSFVTVDDTGAEFDLCADNIAGRPTALVFCPDGAGEAAGELEGFAASGDAFQRLGATVIGVSPEPVSEIVGHKENLSFPFTILSDEDKSVFTAYDIATSGAPTTVLLRPNRHVLGIVDNGVHASIAVEMFEKIRAAEGANGAGYPPPVLVVPDVLSAEDCQRLIDIYLDEDTPYVDLGEADASDCDVKTMVPDYGRVDRIDHRIKNRDTVKFVTNRLQTRLLPEMKKAFHYKATSFEGLRIACYEGERRGEAHGHRDNSKPEVAYRRFAVSINLNSESFEGGELQFPEYGPQRFKGEPGAAMVFSCSMLHEALQVERGHRFALLLFLSGDN